MTGSETAPPTLGSLLAGRYRLEQVVGRGGMADVYRATDELLGRTVAVKLMRAGAADSDTDRLRIAAEMRTLAGLRHPGLVTLFDAGAGDDTSGGAPYLVMDFIAGPTLRGRLAAARMSPLEVAVVGHDIALALRYVHEHDIVHRDVKPANILLDVPGSGDAIPAARLTDFGIAQVADHTRHTVQGTTVGTANYLSPEQARGRRLTAASDTYSLGLLLLEALTGEVAFPGTGIEAAVARLHRDPLVPATLDPRWQHLLRAATAQDPAHRPDDRWLVAALAGLAGRAGDPPPFAPTEARGTVPSPTEATGTAAMGTVPTGTVATAALSGLPAGDTAVLPGPLAPHGRRHGRLRTAWLVGGVIAALLVVLVVALVATSAGSGPSAQGPITTPTRSTGAAPTSTSPSVTTYADVDGRLGRDLRRAESLVGDSARLGALRADLQTLARAAAAGHYGSARAALTDFESDAAAARAAGSIGNTRLTQLRSIAGSLATDLHRAGTSSSSPAATRTPAAASTAAGPPAGPAGGPGNDNAPPGQAKKSDKPGGGPGGH